MDLNAARITIRAAAFLITVAAALQIFSHSAATQSKSTFVPPQRGSIAIKSAAITPGQLPPPGGPLRIPVELLNTDQVNKSLRAIAALDGELIEVPVQGGRINQRYHPEYFIEIAAPRHTLTWEFMLELPDGSTIRSERGAVQRSCVLPYEMIDLDEHWQVGGNEILSVCMNRAEALERELTAYARSIELTEKLKKTLGLDEK